MKNPGKILEGPALYFLFGVLRAGKCALLGELPFDVSLYRSETSAGLKTQVCFAERRNRHKLPFPSKKAIIPPNSASVLVYP